jgi:uncharacterized membrane protein YphA (DoxX/SURF4 family)
MKLSQHFNLIDQKKRTSTFIILRVALGLSLLVKGIQFVQNNSIIRNVFSDSLILQNYLWVQTFIPWLNLLGGVFIVIGLFTRFAALVQIPIITGAIIFVNSKHGIYEGESNVLFSIVLLLLLIFFVIQGSGKPSLDMALRKKLEN